jgi:hypothetical protein
MFVMFQSRCVFHEPWSLGLTSELDTQFLFLVNGRPHNKIKEVGKGGEVKSLGIGKRFFCHFLVLCECLATVLDRDLDLRPVERDHPIR